MFIVKQDILYEKQIYLLYSYSPYPFSCLKSIVDNILNILFSITYP